jgi:hypothetical protein
VVMAMVVRQPGHQQVQAFAEQGDTGACGQQKDARNLAIPKSHHANRTDREEEKLALIVSTRRRTMQLKYVEIANAAWTGAKFDRRGQCSRATRDHYARCEKFN